MKTRKPIPKQGDIIRVVFWDHTENMPFSKIEAVGRVIEVNKRPPGYVLAAWMPLDGENREENATIYNILKSTVVELVVLKETVDG